MPASRSASCICTIFCARAWRRFVRSRRVGKGAQRRAHHLAAPREWWARFALPTLRLCSRRKSRRLLLQRQRQPVREIRHGVIESAQQDDLEYLRLVVMRRQAANSASLSVARSCSASTAAISACSACDQQASVAAPRTVARTCSSVRCAAAANVATCTPHSYSQPVRAQVRSMTISRSRNDSGPRSSRLPARNFSQARALPAMTRNSTSGGAPRMMRSNCSAISGA